MCFFKPTTKTEYQFPDTLKIITKVKMRKYDISDFLKAALTYLGYTNITLAVVYDTRTLDDFSTKDVKLQALLDKSPLDHTYTLLLRTNLTESLEMILCHEMIHLDQYERGDLIVDRKDKNLFTWKGRMYDPSLSYNARPWEQEAFRKQTKIYKQVKQILK